jgi:hypothetical protein
MNHLSADRILKVIASAADAVKVLEGSNGAAATRLAHQAEEVVESLMRTQAARARAGRKSRRK